MCNIDDDRDDSQVECEDRQSSSIRHVITLGPEQWNHIKPTYKGDRLMLNSNWRDYILTVLEQKCNCVIAFGRNHVSSLNSRKKKVPYILQQAYCTFTDCFTFRISVCKSQQFSNTVEIQILIFGEENHGRQSRRFRRTSCEEAKEIGKKLKYERPTDVYETLINESPMNKLLAGNYNIPKSPAVLRRLKSLINNSERLHKDVSI